MTENNAPSSSDSNKSSFPVWGWVAIGCGGLLIFGAIVFFFLTAFVFSKGKDMLEEASGAESFDEFIEKIEDDPARTYAEMAIRMNPDLELIETDESAGTITFRNTETGEEATLNFEDIAEGRFSITTDEGEYRMDADEDGGGVTFQGPEGETRYGGSASLDDVPEWVPLYPRASESHGTFSTRTDEMTAGGIMASTDDDAQTVIAHYKEWLEDHDWTIESEGTNTSADVTIASLHAVHAENGSRLSISVTEQGGQSQVMLNYNVEN